MNLLYHRPLPLLRSISNRYPQAALRTFATMAQFRPKQALQPSPQLFDLLVADTMINMATASVAQVGSIPSGSVVLDNGCGSGAGTAAFVHAASQSKADITVHGTDKDPNALGLYSKRIAENKWPAKAEQQDALKLSFADGTFSHSIMNALLFGLPDEGAGGVAEAYRTLKSGGVFVANAWNYVPNESAVQAASKATRPAGTPLPLQEMQKWSDPEFVRAAIAKGGFQPDKIKLSTAPVECLTEDLDQFSKMVWSFIGGMKGWLESDEQHWDEAVQIIKTELKKTPGFEERPGGGAKIQFVANIAVATK